MIKKEKNGTVWFEFESLQPHSQLAHAVLALSDKPIAPVPTVLANQVHKDNVHIVEEGDDYSQIVPNTDALITNKKQIALGIRHADCQAAIFFDPEHEVIACIHAGWRGNCQNIYKKTIAAMKEGFGTDPAALICCIGPSLGPEKAEFINYKTELPESFWRFGNSKNYFNLWEIGRWQLESEGVKQIEIASLCTYSNPDLFYSYRRDKTALRNLTSVWLTS